MTLRELSMAESTGIVLDGEKVRLNDVLAAAKANGKIRLKSGDEVFVVTHQTEDVPRQAIEFLMKGGPDVSDN